MRNDCLFNYINRIKKAIIKANRAIASVKAKPKIANRNNSSFIAGLREVPKIREAKINPIPTPAPAKPKVDSPAPIFCEACNNIRNSGPGFLVFVFGRTLTCKAVKPTNLQYAAFNVWPRKLKTLIFGRTLACMVAKPTNLQYAAFRRLATKIKNKIGQIRTDDTK